MVVRLFGFLWISYILMYFGAVSSEERYLKGG